MMFFPRKVVCDSCGRLFEQSTPGQTRCAQCLIKPMRKAARDPELRKELETGKGQSVKKAEKKRVRSEYETRVGRLHARRGYYRKVKKPAPADLLQALETLKAAHKAGKPLPGPLAGETVHVEKSHRKESPGGATIAPRPQDAEKGAKKVHEATRRTGKAALPPQEWAEQTRRDFGAIRMENARDEAEAGVKAHLSPDVNEGWVRANSLVSAGLRPGTTFVTPVNQACEAFAKINATSLHYVVEKGDGRRLEITITRDKQ